MAAELPDVSSVCCLKLFNRVRGSNPGDFGTVRQRSGKIHPTKPAADKYAGVWFTVVNVLTLRVKGAAGLTVASHKSWFTELKSVFQKFEQLVRYPRCDVSHWPRLALMHI